MICPYLLQGSYLYCLLVGAKIMNIIKERSGGRDGKI